MQRRLRIRRLALLSSLSIAALASPASAATTTALPAAGATWTGSGSCGTLCSTTADEPATGGAPGAFLRMRYRALAGLAGTYNGHAAWTSPSFTSSGGAPSGVRLAGDRFAQLGSLLTIAGGAARLNVELVDVATGSATLLSSTQFTQSDTAWTPISKELPGSTLVAGRTYRLRATSTFGALIALVGESTIGLDNLRLEATVPAPAPTASQPVISGGLDRASATFDLATHGEAAQWHLEIGTSTAYGRTVSGSVQAGAPDGPVTAAIDGLEPATTYHARLRVITGDHTVVGPDVAFTTRVPVAPREAGGPSVALTAGGADLSTSVVPGEAPLDWWVEVTGAAGTTTTPVQTTPASLDPTTLRASLALPAGSTSTARFVFRSAFGTTYGAAATVTIPAADEPPSGGGGDTPPAPPAISGVVADASSRGVAVDFTVGSAAGVRSHIEWGTSEAFGAVSAEVAGDGPQQIAFGGLVPSTTYHARLVVESSSGRSTHPFTFTTDAAVVPAPVADPPAAEVAPTTATVHQSVVPGDLAGEWWVEFGEPSAEPRSTQRLALAAGTDPVALSARLDGLAAGTTYEYRFAVETADGVVRTDVRSLTTTQVTPPAEDPGDETPAPPTVSDVTADPSSRGVEVGFTVGASTGARSHIAWGTSERYGAVTAEVAGDGPQTIAFDGLVPGTAYDALLVVESSSGRTTHPFTFTTDAAVAPSPVADPPAAQVAETTATVHQSVTPGDLPGEWWVEFGVPGQEPRSTQRLPLAAGTEPVALSAQLDGLTASTTYEYRFVVSTADGVVRTEARSLTTTQAAPPAEEPGDGDTGSGGGEPPVTAPAVSGVTTDATSRAVEVAFTVAGPADTRSYVEWGTTDALGTVTPAVTGDGPQRIAFDGLAPGTAYVARLVVESSSGRTTHPFTFTTDAAVAPAPVADPPAADVGETTATVHQSVVPGDLAGEWWVEFGLPGQDPKATSRLALAAGNDPVALSARLEGLAAGTTYAYRFVIVTADGTVRTEARQLTTTQPAPPAKEPDAGTPDSGTPDTGTPDTGTPDTGTPDTGTPDTATPDTGTDAGKDEGKATETVADKAQDAGTVDAARTPAGTDQGTKAPAGTTPATPPAPAAGACAGRCEHLLMLSKRGKRVRLTVHAPTSGPGLRTVAFRLRKGSTARKRTATLQVGGTTRKLRLRRGTAKVRIAGRTVRVRVKGRRAMVTGLPRHTRSVRLTVRVRTTRATRRMPLRVTAKVRTSAARTVHLRTARRG